MRLGGQRGKSGLGQRGEVLGGKFDFQAAAAGADEHGGKVEGGVVDVGGQALFLAQWADAAEDVARAAGDQGFVGHGGFLGVGGLGDVFHVEHGAHGDDGDGELDVV